MTSQFGAQLRRLRLQAGMTHEQLVERSGLSVRTIRRLESGESANPQLDTVRLLADALRLTPDQWAHLLAAAGSRVLPDSPSVTGVRPESAVERRLAEAADDLALAVGARLSGEEELRRIQDPFPLPVRWRLAPDDVMDHWANICRVSPGGSAKPLDLAGQLDEIADVYRRIPSGRLVVLGRAGSGKSVLAARFVLDLLGTRARGDAVPVVFGLGSWNPTTTGFRDWLAGQLKRDHPALAATGRDGSDLATALVEAGRILPVLDGFDELAAGLHRAALDELNATTLPLLLTSRPGEYAAVAGTGALTAAAAVRLTDLTVSDLVDYLPRTTRKDAGATRWDPVLTELRDHPQRPASVNLRAVLTTPLMVGLAREIYSDPAGRDPSVLLDSDRFGSQYELEDHLLDSFIPTVYRDQPGRRYRDPDGVQRWLGYLARHLDRLGMHDLAWWQLGSTVRPSSRMLMVGVAVGLVFGVAGGLVDWLGAGPIVGPLSALVGGLVFGLAHVVGGSAVEPSRIRMRFPRMAWRARALVPRFMIGLVLGVVAGLRQGPVAGLVAGLLGGVVVGLTTVLEVPVDTRSAANPSGLLRANQRTVVVQGLALGLVFGVAVGLTHGLRYGLVLGLAGGLTFALTAWGRWLVVARIWLPLTGRLPWALIAFLDDACRRGVLRQAGAVYQFRHARLQAHLTDHLTRVVRTHDDHRDTGASTVTVTIYLSDEEAHERVEAAVEDFLASAGARVERREEPVMGSWFRRMQARFGRDVLSTVAHAVDARLVLAQDAAVTAELLQHLGPVITSLSSTKEAVIRTGALLIVKIDDKVVVHQLTASQQLQLDHQPDLAISPHEILTALRLEFTGTATSLPPSTTTRMPVLSFPGAYEDDQGVEPVVWRIEPSHRNSDKRPRFEIHTAVRGMSIRGPDLDSLGELDHCTLRGDLPCTIDIDGLRQQSVVHFALDLRNKTRPPTAANLYLSAIVDGMTYTVTDEWFGDGLQRLEDALPDGVQLVCCVTCLYSGYSPGEHGLLGIACHRGAKDKYLAVRSEADYRSVPVTEEVPETYLCPDYQRRVPGTGYRG